MTLRIKGGGGGGLQSKLCRSILIDIMDLHFTETGREKFG